jgi:FkbM family methyltransferase
MSLQTTSPLLWQRFALPNLFAQARGVIHIIRLTRSWTCVRLFWRGERTPRRVPGAFQFPFGQVRYVDAAAMSTLYREIFLDHEYEVAGLGDAPTIIDCGGNIGMSVIWFKQRYPGACITVFEADPAIAEVLEENVQTLGLTSVEVVRAAVGGSAGQVTFVPEGSLSGYVSNGPGITVEAVRLSERISEPVDFLKIDIEGSEFDLIRDLCASGKIGLVRHLSCELHVQPEVQDKVAELWMNLSQAGFRITVRNAILYEELAGPPVPTPFPAARSGKYLIWLYAWRS